LRVEKALHEIKVSIVAPRLAIPVTGVGPGGRYSTCGYKSQPSTGLFLLSLECNPLFSLRRSIVSLTLLIPSAFRHLRLTHRAGGLIHAGAWPHCNGFPSYRSISPQRRESELFSRSSLAEFHAKLGHQLTLASIL